MVIGIGLDLVDIDRMQLAVKRTPCIVNKILSPIELADLDVSTSQQDLHLQNRFISSLAARFAAKEATVKSLGLSLFVVGLHSIEILTKDSGAPVVKFDTYRNFLISIDISDNAPIEFLCSLTHTTNSASAVVVAQYISRVP